MNSNTAIREHLNCRADVHCISTEAIELRHDQYVAFFHLQEQFGKPRSLARANATGNAFSDDAAFVDRKAGQFNFTKLIRCRLIGCADAGVCKGAGHVVAQIVRKGCPNIAICPKLSNHYFRTWLCAHVRKGTVSDMPSCPGTDGFSVRV
ncbi:hypothetical protein DO64_4775 [Burkholderia pseudomallei]|nr:hypothetical protein DO64_4775 [Burkholderia pseudomallei]